MHPPRSVAEQASAVLNQCCCIIEALPDEVYVAPSTTLKGGSIGKHVRHTLDHYRVLIEGHAEGQTVLYDRRERGVPAESSRSDALAAAHHLRSAIAALSADALAEPVRICVMLSGDGTEAEMMSTLGRELAFASHHAIHHCAMMKAIAEEMGHTIESGFGVAPSTLHYEASTQTGVGAMEQPRS